MISGHPQSIMATFPLSIIACKALNRDCHPKMKVDISVPFPSPSSNQMERQSDNEQTRIDTLRIKTK